MSKCTRPIYSLDLGIKENGKRNLKILPRRFDLSSIKQLQARYGDSSIVPLPCGECLNCKLNKAKEWAVRCVLEASLFDENYFVTLTYDDEHYPGDASLHREHVQEFIKLLRYYSPGLRYFGCGEYGSHTHRAHYHLIIFNLKLDDLKPCGAGLYESATIKHCWPYGFNMIGEVSYSSCNYVARYTTKKLFGDKYDDEFLMMSTHPGIAADWFKEHFDITMAYDSVFGKFGNSKAVKLPRYFEKIAEVLDVSLLDDLKKSRIDKSKSFTLTEMIAHGIDEQEKLLSYKELCGLNDYRAKHKGDRL